MHQSHPCPKCGRVLDPEGEAIMAGETIGIYSCDHCAEPWNFDGQVFETALTFGVTEEGRVLTSAELET